MNKPKDIKLYNKVKKNIYLKYPNHSAYRSGLLVKQYKSEYEKKYNSKNAYTGIKPKTTGLKRWMKEKWMNQRGEVGYKYKSDIYRPTVRINKKTPTTFKELSKKDIDKARKEKLLKGRVKKF